MRTGDRTWENISVSDTGRETVTMKDAESERCCQSAGRAGNESQRASCCDDLGLGTKRWTGNV